MGQFDNPKTEKSEKADNTHLRKAGDTPALTQLARPKFRLRKVSNQPSVSFAHQQLVYGAKHIINQRAKCRQ